MREDYIISLIVYATFLHVVPSSSKDGITRHSALEFLGVTQNISALEWDDVIFNCTLEHVVFAADKVVVEWRKQSMVDERPRVKTKGELDVHFYKNGGVYNAGQDQAYKGRTSLFKEELFHGNASLMLTNVRVSDSGIYKCINPPHRVVTAIHLTVGAATEPHAKILHATDSGGVLMSCISRGGCPEPKMEWQDDRGNVLPATTPDISINPDGCFTVTLNVTIPYKTKTNQYRCVVTQEDIGHITYDDIHIPDKMFYKAYETSMCKMSLYVLGSAILIVILILTCVITSRGCSTSYTPLQDKKESRRSSHDSDDPN